MNNDEKLVTYLYDDGAWGLSIAGDLDALTAIFRNEVDALKDGEAMEFNVKRHDMTQAEINAAPVQ